MESSDHGGSGDAGVSGHMSMGNGRNGNGRMSPSSNLKFGQAKKDIIEVFKDVLNLAEGIERSGYIEEVEQQNLVKKCREVVSGILEVLSRDHMKVVFFGRTSNGKSTTINAMLREKILPTGIGHTTHCFLQVEGLDSHEGYLLTEEEPDEHKRVELLKQLASALSSVKLKENSRIRILWPKNKCSLLKEDVVLVDSPGTDIKADLDMWIDKFCMDADVFVLVLNAGSTLMQTEKKFFRKVNEKLSKPNILILQNHWDISASEDDVDQVKQQHLEGNLEFLCDELKLMDRKEGKDRVFFVSAKEALALRLKEMGTPIPTGVLQEGYQERLDSFVEFETVFEECISKSAVHTKFEQHTHRGKSIIAKLQMLMEGIVKKSEEQIEDAEKTQQEMADELKNMEEQLKLLNTEINDKIKELVENVKIEVSTALNKEIDGLAILVTKFEKPFPSDETLLNSYKEALHVYLEECIRQNLIASCSGSIQVEKDKMDNHMIERLSALLPEEALQELHTVLPTRDGFEIAYILSCLNSFAGFQEEIDFINTLRHMQRTVGEHLFESLTAPVSIGGGIVTIFMGHKFQALIGFGMCSVLYGCSELPKWSNKAKERAFKYQYTDYASSRLRSIVDHISSNCSNLVKRELTSTFKRLCDAANITKSKLENEIKQKDNVIAQLRDVVTQSKTFKDNAVQLDKALDTFRDTFLTETQGVQVETDRS